jgi:hypothetical protein
MQEGERRLGWIESLQGQVRHDCRVFTDGVKHDWLFELRHDFADDVDAFRFQLF